MARSELEAQGLAELRGMLLHPATLLLVAVDAVPAVGVLFWQWDAFVLLIMQVTIIVGAFIAVGIGSLAPLIILVVLKTLADVALHLVLDFGPRTRQRSTPTLAAG